MVGCKVYINTGDNCFCYHDGLSKEGAKALAKELEEQGKTASAFDDDGWLIL